MSFFDSHGNKDNHDFKNKCKGCACDILKKATQGTLVNIVLKGGDEFFEDELAFVCFDPKTCCVTFILDGYPFIIDCENIAGIQIVSS
ncbi:hydrolase [Fictibacillus sp. NPDC058756]|uniref:hydrolase n=1 Tax=Fictibacillus sp. NPDC058756 TaxID=3346625 RepID=UPI00369D2EA6